MTAPHVPLPLCGRDTPLQHLLDRASTGGSTTLHGPGGIGKTRLAVEVARRCRRRGQAVLFTSVYEGARPDGLFRSLVRAAAVPRGFFASGTHAERVCRWVGEGALVVVDEAELSIEAAREVVVAMADGGVHVLVTSREVLGLADEVAVELPPLAIEHAVEVLVAAAPHGTVRDPACSRRVCERLEGLPLALTLAAGRLHVMSLSELERRLTEPLPMLRNPGSEGRHRTLRASVDASLAGLSEAERRLLRGTAVFASHFSADDAEAILADVEGMPPVAAGLDWLARRSVLRRLDGRAARYQLAPFVRDVLLADEGLPPSWRAKWVQFIAARAFRSLTDQQSGASDGAWLADNEAEVLRAFEHVRAHPHADPEATSRLAAVVLATPGSIPTREALSEAIDPLLAPGADAEALAVVEQTRGSLASRRGDAHGALSAFDRALGHARRARAPGRQAMLFGMIGNVWINLGDDHRAVATFREGLALARQTGNDELIARPTIALALMEDMEFSYRPERLLQRLEAIPSSPTPTGAWLHFRCAQVAWALGRTDATLRHLNAFDPDSLEPPFYARLEMLLLRATLQMGAGAFAASEQSIDAAFERARWGGFQRLEAMAAIVRGQLDLRRGQPEAALVALAPWVEQMLEGRPDWAGVALLAEAVRACAAARIGDADRRDAAVARIGSIANREGIEPVVPRLVPILPDILAVLEGVSALERGASDVRVAPEAVARIRSLEPRYEFRLREIQQLALDMATRLQALSVAWVSFGLEGFASPEGVHVDLSRSPTRGRLFAALLRARIAEPGVAVPVDALFAAGWAGEQATPRSARNRVYVGVAFLRKAGLGDVLQRVRGGYRLDPDVCWRGEGVL
jgi:predicted ATPase